tara:strand:- start:13892 stop:14707 length:816 start_codon:yes stop_codon:yes gene_type:complete
MDYHIAAEQIRILSGSEIPKVGLILGSGLGGIARSITVSTKTSFKDLHGFPEATVSGHSGQLILGTWEGIGVACLQGRSHLYEGHSIQKLTTPIRALKLAGCEILILTCAAGSLNEDMQPGDLMLIKDHINWSGLSPLTGLNDDKLGARFVDMSEAYDRNLLEIARQTAKQSGFKLHEGVYVWSLGPNFETPAEIRAFRQIGANAVGMSTVPECITAVHCGLRVLAVSVMTNLAAGLQANVSHEETLTMGKQASPKLEQLLNGIIKNGIYG